MRPRAPRRVLPLLTAFGLVCASAAWGQSAELERRYPPGSITTEELAERALTDTSAAAKASDARFEREEARCAHVILKTQCNDKAHRTQTLEHNQIHRIELEAHDLQRQVAAQRRAQQRQADEQQRLKLEAQQPEKERQAQVAAQKRQSDADQREQDALRQQASAPTNRQRYEQKNAQHDRDEKAHIDARLRNVAQNEKRFDDKQKQAREYADSRAREREQNEKNRLERQAKREQQNAQSDAAAPPQP